MKKITEKIEQNLEQDFVVNGEGCLDDCPHRDSWVVDGELGCGWHNTAFLSDKK